MNSLSCRTPRNEEIEEFLKKTYGPSQSYGWFFNFKKEGRLYHIEYWAAYEYVRKYYPTKCEIYMPETDEYKCRTYKYLYKGDPTLGELQHILINMGLYNIN